MVNEEDGKRKRREKKKPLATCGLTEGIVFNSRALWLRNVLVFDGGRPPSTKHNRLSDRDGFTNKFYWPNLEQPSKIRRYNFKETYTRKSTNLL